MPSPIRRIAVRRRRGARGRADRLPASRPDAPAGLVRCNSRRTLESDPPEFVARVEAEARRRLGGALNDVVPEPELREMMYNAFAEALRQEPRPVAPEIAALAARLAEHGMILTPGSGDVRDLPKPVTIRGVTLSDAVIDERYGY